MQDRMQTPSRLLDLFYGAVFGTLFPLFPFAARSVPARESRPSFMGSTDMGNVSHAVPSIHPMIKAAPDGVAIHTAEFATHAGGALGDAAVVDGALAMALTAVDLWAEPGRLEAARELLRP